MRHPIRNSIMRSTLLFIAVLCISVAATPLVAATFIVNTTNDSGAGSLRAAIDSSNTVPGTDSIHFNIAGTSPHTIALLSALPTITDQVTIDGYSEPEASAK